MKESEWRERLAAQLVRRGYDEKFAKETADDEFLCAMEDGD
jgi:hypothetical protein